MRNELVLIERIEAYLHNQLSAAEREAFELELSADPELREKLQLQQQVYKGLERTALKMSVQRAARRYKINKLVKLFSVIILIVILSVAVFYYLNKKHTYHLHQVPKENTPLPVQAFRINPATDTILETAGGITFSISANTFLDGDGIVSGPVDLVIKEALDAASIMQSGLSTKSGDRLLETGGMFYIQATSGGKALKIKYPIYTEIPAKNVLGGMQLYKGELTPDSTIDWTSPVPLEHDLVPVDINDLNFYPPNYRFTLFTAGYDTLNKAFTDSVYYSFTPSSGGNDSSKSPCGINPSNVKAIWTEQFQQTIIATREFEERMHWLHYTCDNELLELYIKNLDKPISDIDRMVAEKLTGKLKEKFLSFASRQGGKVKTNTQQKQRLLRYYKLKSSAFATAIAETQKALRKNDDSLRKATMLRKQQYEKKVDEAYLKHFKEELAFNMQSAYKQLGYNAPPPAPAARSVYTASITSTGWYNIDREVMEATLSKQSNTISANGKQAIINYQTVSFVVDTGYDRTYFYLLPRQLNSYIRMSYDEGTYTEKLNSAIDYSVVCLAYKGKDIFVYASENIQAGEYGPVPLTKTNEKTVVTELNKYHSQYITEEILENEKYLYDIFRYEQHEKERESLEELRYSLWHVIFPCSQLPATQAAPAI